MTDVPVVSLEDVSKTYGHRRVVDRATVALRRGRVTCLMGPSGCGKSTLLRLIAGLEPVDEGRILAGDTILSSNVQHKAPEQRSVGLVFQDLALFPHLTAVQNVAFGLAGGSPTGRRARALEVLARVQLADRADHYPHMLSGGEQQRVAIARAMAPEPVAILLDEPFSSLDGTLRAEVREMALGTLRKSGAAILLVTHDAEEAMQSADEVVLMSSGRILQAGAPEETYLRPVSLEAGRLLGAACVFSAQVRGGRAETPFGILPAPGRLDGPARLMVRPEGLCARPHPHELSVRARVCGVNFMGSVWQVRVEINGVQAICRQTERPPSDGEVWVVLSPDRGWLLPPG